MSFDYASGLFSWDQWQRFIAYARSQLPLIEGRIVHLQQEQLRIGTYAMQFQNGIPTGYAADSGSYIGKLLAAYKVLGGDPEFDLQLRALSDPVYLLPGEPGTQPQAMSDGSIMGSQGIGASEPSQYMQQARGWLDETLRGQREVLERKIRRALDYADQLQNEIDYLNLAVGAASLEGSLENIYEAVVDLFNDSMFRPLYKDPPDPHGLYVRVPLGGREPGENGPPAEDYQKSGTKGVLFPGST